MTLIFGPAVLFITFNFADLYSPICIWMDDGPSSSSSSSTNVRLRVAVDDPYVPSLREMRRRLSKNPRALAKFFLLMQELACRFILGIDDIHLGKHYIAPSARWPRSGAAQPAALREDVCCASSGPSLVGFPTAAFAPVESQGRAFIPHAHMKVHAAVGLRFRELRSLFAADAEELQNMLAKYTAALLEAGASVQYESVRECGHQLGVELPPAPFSAEQQRQSRLDGGQEVDGEQRINIPVTPAEKPGYILREAAAAAAENRQPVTVLGDIPLTGAEQSLLPRYRNTNQAFAIYTLDACGRPTGAEQSGGNSICDDDRDPCSVFAAKDGRITGALLQSGEPATKDDMLADAKHFAKAYATDARSLHVRNHMHQCHETCLKNQKKKHRDQVQEQLQRNRVPTCRFWFFHVITFSVFAHGRRCLRRVRRRGRGQEMEREEQERWINRVREKER